MELSSQIIACFNSLLRGEICATEIYRYTLDNMTRPKWRACLEDCMQSHARRAQLLRRRIQALGGIPTRGSGTWGVCAKAFAVGADMLGPLAAIATLELGEAHGRLAYVRKLDRFDPHVRAFVETQLLPAQIITHDWITELKRTSADTLVMDP
jgi:demethoxyubiquinone hydroxylase (CLK1/Coq7/Cat5 family)